MFYRASFRPRIDVGRRHHHGRHEGDDHLKRSHSHTDQVCTTRASAAVNSRPSRGGSRTAPTTHIVALCLRMLSHLSTWTGPPRRQLASPQVLSRRSNRATSFSFLIWN